MGDIQALTEIPSDSLWHEHQDQSGLWWMIRWTGWKKIPSSADLVSQHVACPVTEYQSTKRDPLRPMVYASFPGARGVFNDGDALNIARRPEQQDLLSRWPSAFSTADDLSLAQSWNFKRLREFIEKAARIDWYGNPQLLRVPPSELDRAIEET